MSLEERLMALFAGLDNVHGTHGTPKLDANGVKWSIKNSAKTLREPVTLELVKQHVEGKRPLGIVPIDAKNECVWGSVDIDDYSVDVSHVLAELERLKLPLVPCRSKSGGLHLFLFLTAPAPAAEVQAALRDIAASMGFGGSEIFPKQTNIHAEKGDHGNWMIIPYFGGDFDGKLKMQYGLKKTGMEMMLKEFLDYAEKRKVEPDKLSVLRVKKPRKEKAPFHDGPPCLQHLAESGFPEGGRNNALFHMGVYFKRSNESDWQKLLEEANHKHMKPPLSTDEVKSVIRSLERKDYEYKCKDQPMASHCDSMACRTRKFGVGAGGAYPEIRGLRKLNTEPAVWFVDVEETSIMMSTEDLQNYVRFHRLCMEHAHRCYRMVSQPLWLMLVSDAMEHMTVIQAPPDIGVGGHFFELLEAYLTNSRRGETKDDLLSNRPWEDEDKNRHYFVLSDLIKFLDREGMKIAKRVDVTERIRKLGGDADFFNIKGKGKSVWYVPSEKIKTMPQLDIPKMQGDPM